MHAMPVSEQFMPAAPIALPSILSLRSIIASHSWHWHWSYVVYLLLVWQTAAIFWKFWWKAPVQPKHTRHHCHVLILLLVKRHHRGTSDTAG